MVNRVLARLLLPLVAMLAVAALSSCRAKTPGSAETALVDELKKSTIGGRDWKNPIPDTPDAVKIGAEHFQHHCAICHGLDGHNTGVPFAEKMSPPVADLGARNVQQYGDGQLKWIIQNGIRFTGMPAWSGILDDGEIWHVVLYLRHLPAKGSLGVPAVYKESEEEHQHMEQGTEPAQPHQHPVPAHEHQH
jgi:mono/diheme cytochrome c family protein